VKIPGLQVLAYEDTRRISDELIGSNKQAVATLQEQGSCDISYSLPGQCRFRVNIFVQRGSHAIVMRAIPKSIPSFADRRARPALAMKMLMVIVMLAVMAATLRSRGALRFCGASLRNPRRSGRFTLLDAGHNSAGRA
jgi:Tfp pilus assembly pilus retraction ATPase PilT